MKLKFIYKLRLKYIDTHAYIGKEEHLLHIDILRVKYIDTHTHTHQKGGTFTIYRHFKTEIYRYTLEKSNTYLI